MNYDAPRQESKNQQGSSQTHNKQLVNILEKYINRLRLIIQKPKQWGKNFDETIKAFLGGGVVGGGGGGFSG